MKDSQEKLEEKLSEFPTHRMSKPKQDQMHKE